MVFDKQPFATEPHEMIDKLRLNDDDLEDALEPLVKYDYLNFDDGRGPVGEGNEPKCYRMTKKGRRYVRENWPERVTD